MKRLSLLLLLLLTTLSLKAQEGSRWSLGPRMSLYTNTGDRAIVGLGAFARYCFTDELRLEPSILGLCSSGCSIDANLDLHYLFHLNNHWTIYPLMGVAVNEIGDWAAGINVGAGFDFRVAESWDLTAGMKWMPMFKSSRRNPIAITVGGCYRF